MDELEHIVTMLDYTLSTKQKRHIVGGMLLSVAFLFGGLALTVMTLQKEENGDDYE